MALNNLPSSLQAAIQQGFLEREFETSLKAKLGFRSVADREAFPAGIGETLTKTRPGLFATVSTPLTPAGNTDLTSGLSPQNVSIEQYTLTVQQYANTANLNIATSKVAIANVFLRNASNLAEQAARSVDQIAANALYNAYMGGNTRVRTTLGSNGVAVAVDDIRGFQQTVTATGALVNISGSNPVPVAINGNVYSLVGATADGSNVSTSPGGISGVLTFAASVVIADGTAGKPVLSSQAPNIIRPNNAATTLGLTSTSTLTVASILSAKAQLEANNIPTDSDGFYNCFADPQHLIGLYADPAFQQFFRGEINTPEYRMGVIAKLMGVKIVKTNMNPNSSYNGIGTVRRAIITGEGALVEGVFTNEGYAAANEVDDGNLTMVVDGIAHITREPIDTLKQVVTQSWAYMGGFSTPSDLLTTAATIPTASNAMFKRAVVIESV